MGVSGWGRAWSVAAGGGGGRTKDESEVYRRTFWQTDLHNADTCMADRRYLCGGCERGGAEWGREERARGARGGEEKVDDEDSRERICLATC